MIGGGVFQNTGSTSLRGSDYGFMPGGYSYDIKPLSDGSYSLEQMHRLLYDLRLEPEWRDQAAIEHAYYDGDQLSQESLRKMQEYGIPALVTNMIQPAINAVRGFEVISRSDPRVMPETDENYEVATALNQKLKEASRLSHFNRGCSDAFGDMIKGGIGWIEVSRNADPFKYPYRVRSVPWREMFTDYRSREHDFSDGRFIVRRQWHDFDKLIAWFPKHERLIRTSLSGWPGEWLAEWEDMNIGGEAVNLNFAHNVERRFTLEEDEWRQTARGRMALYEVIYKVPREVVAIRTPDGFTAEFNVKQPAPAHVDAVNNRQATLIKGVTDSLRRAYYVGPHRLHDAPLPGNRSHYIPLVCYRRDSDGAVYGLIRAMRSPQEALNARHTRSVYNLVSNRVIIDEDAVEDHDQTAQEINKADSYIILKSDRANIQGIHIRPNTDTNNELMQLMMENKQNIFDVTGLHPEFQGMTQSAGQSGVAIESLIEQTTQVLGVPVDNYREARRMAAEGLLAMIVEDLEAVDNIEVEVPGDGMSTRRQIVLNRRDGQYRQRDNDLVHMRTRVALAESPSSVTYRQQRFQQLTEIVKSMPEEIQAAMTDLVVRASELPDNEEILDRIWMMTGHGPEPKDPEKREQRRQMQEQQQQKQDAIERLEMAVAEAEGRMKAARAKLDEAKAIKTAGADTAFTQAETQETLEGIRQKEDELDLKEREVQIHAVEARKGLVEAAAKLEAEKNKPVDKPASKAKG